MRAWESTFLVFNVERDLQWDFYPSSLLLLVLLVLLLLGMTPALLLGSLLWNCCAPSFHGIVWSSSWSPPGLGTILVLVCTESTGRGLLGVAVAI